MPTDSYPHLFNISTEAELPLGDQQSVTVAARPDAEITLQQDADSQALFRLFTEDDAWFLEPTDGAPVSINQVPVTARQPVSHLSIIQADRTVLVFIAHNDTKVSSTCSANLWLIGQMIDLPPLPNLADNATIELEQGMRENMAGLTPLELPGKLELTKREMRIGRDADQADICLPDVRVSRVHASIVRDGRTAVVTDLNSANGTYVNGDPVLKPTVVREDDRIQIGPYDFVLRNRALYPVSQHKHVELIARGLSREVPDRRRPGNSVVILDDISLVIRPHEFVCILGPSGSGKTTLLSALSARVQADQGTVALNGQDLYSHFDALKQNLTVVPQRDVLHDVLPLNVALWYTAKLRLPADMSRTDIDARIDEMLDSVNLTQHQFKQIRRLSGGQIKRASCINEVICDPSLVFLDEVTSGLDEQADSEMMSLFRSMADAGKTVVCVTHSMTYVERNCHLVVILAPGGALAFIGPPQEALDYFKIARLGDVYHRLKEKDAEEWKEQFRQSRQYEEYVEQRLPDDKKSMGPKFARQRQRRRATVQWRQFVLLTRRYLAIKWADKRSLAMMFGQSLFIAGLLVWLFGNISQLDIQKDADDYAQFAFGVSIEDLSYLPDEQQKILDKVELGKRADLSSRLLFLLCISSIWLGCNSAAKELVKERSIFSKERDVGLSVLSYYGSKILLLAVLGILQVALLFFIVRYFTQLGGDMPRQLLILVLSALAGIGMGLAISALANTEDLAVTVVPISLIPQIILAGLIAPLLHYTRELSQACITSYWSYQGLLLTLNDDLQEELRDAKTLDIDLGVVWTWPLMFQVLHLTFFSAVALIALYAQDAKFRRYFRLPWAR